MESPSKTSLDQVKGNMISFQIDLLFLRGVKGNNLISSRIKKKILVNEGQQFGLYRVQVKGLLKDNQT